MYLVDEFLKYEIIKLSFDSSGVLEVFIFQYILICTKYIFNHIH